MNNMKSLSILLLLSLATAGSSFAKSDCDSDCYTSSDRGFGFFGNKDCSSNDCNDKGDSCSNGDCSVRTFFRPRQTTTDLTLLNNLSFYDTRHDADCNFLTYSGTLFYQQSRKGKHVGAGFFGKNPVVFGENPNDTTIDFNSVNFGVGIQRAANPANDLFFRSTVSLAPSRRTVGWMSHILFNLDCFMTGAWFDTTFVVLNARHKLRFREDVDGGNVGNLVGEPTTIAEAFAKVNAFSADCKHTGVDDVMFRLGYDFGYCANDHIGVYLLGIAPTGSERNNAEWFQPLVGSRQGAIGAGFTGDYTLWNDEANATDLVFQTELLYQYRFKADEKRIFDYVNNGPLSRYLRVVNQNSVTQINAQANPLQVGFEDLTSCVRVEPRSQIDWWANVHYQWCNWGAEFSYNLWWRDNEDIHARNFDFGGRGIFDNSAVGINTNNPTTGSTTTLATLPLQGVHDATFVSLTNDDVNYCSASAKRVLTNKISGAFAYNNVWSDCYPWTLGFGAAYEFASDNNKCHAFENWSIYGKMDLSW